MQKSKPTQLPNGNRINYGQLLIAGGAPMRKLSVGKLPAAPLGPSHTRDTSLPRDGAPKHHVEPAIAGARIDSDMDQGGGMRDRGATDLHPWLHGQSVNDEVAEKLQTTRNVPTNPGMVSKTMIERGHVGDSNEILNRSVSGLGKHGDIDKGARLPANIVPKRG